MMRDVYYKDPETGKVTITSMYEISANEAVAKWPKEHSFKPWPKTDPADVLDTRPRIPTIEELKGDAEAIGPPVEDRK